MNILIVGGLGFIGSNLVKKLLTDKHTITIIDNAKKIKKLHHVRKSNYELYKMDASSKDCYEIFEISCFDFVVFSAGVTFGSASSKNHLEMDSFINILNLSVKFGIKKLVFISTSFLNDYSPNENKHILSSYPDFNMYISSKYTCEYYCELYAKLYQLKSTIVRLPAIYGPNQNAFSEGGSVYRLFDAVLHSTSKSVMVFGKDIELCYIFDTTKAISKLLYSNETGVFSIRGTKISHQELLSKVQSYNVANKISIHYAFDFSIEPKISNPVYEISASETPLSLGLSKTFEHIKKIKQRDTFLTRKFDLKTSEKMMAHKEWIFSILFGILSFLVKSKLNVPFDFYFIYIIVIGIVFSLKFSLFAAIFSSVSLFFIDTFHFSFLYGILSYFLLAFISGYSSSLKNIEARHAQNTYHQLDKMYRTLKANFKETKRNSSILAEQLKFSENCFGKTYSTIKKISNLSLDAFISEIPDIVSKLTGYDNVTYYSFDKTLHSFEMISSTNSFFSLHTIAYDIDSSSLTNELMKEHKLTMSSSASIALLPVTHVETQDLLGLISIQDLPFDTFNLSQEVKLKIVGDFISDYYTKALASDRNLVKIQAKREVY